MRLGLEALDRSDGMTSVGRRVVDGGTQLSSDEIEAIKNTVMNI